MLGRRRWATASLTVVGRTHREQNAPCEDAAATLALEGTRTVALVVADGAGSARRAAEGSTTAVECALESLDARRPSGRATASALRDLLEDRFSAAVALFAQRRHERLEGSAGSEDDFLTTLAFAVMWGPWLGYAGVGDAFVVVADHRRTVHLVVPPDRTSEYANQTAFLSLRAQPWIRLVYEPRLRGVVLSTDGLAPFLEERIVDTGGMLAPVAWRPAAETFGNMVSDLRNGATAEDLAGVLGGDAFQSRKGDDIGLALAAR